MQNPTGISETFTADLICFMLRPGMTFIDIGAHYEDYALLASRRAGPSGTVIARQPANEAERYALDNLIGDRPVDIVRIAADGHEPRVFRGMSVTLSRIPGIRIFMMFNPASLIKSGHDPGAFLEEIDRNGFDTYFIHDKERQLYRYCSEKPVLYRSILGDGETINLLCIRKEASVFVNLFSHSAGNAGGERLLADTVNFLLEEKFLVHVTLPSEGPLLEILSKLPVSIDIKPLPYWTTAYAPDQEKYIRILVSTLPDIISGIYDRNPHLLFSNTSVIPQGAIAAGMLGLPHIWRITEFGLPEYGIEYLVEESIRKQFIDRGSGKIIFVSDALQDSYSPYLSDNNGITMHSSIQYINSVSSIYPFIKRQVVQIICPATILPGKRQEDLITAVHLLEQKGIRSLQVFLIGGTASEAYEKKLQDLIRYYKLESRITIVPYTDHIWDKFKDAEMVVSTSVNEGFGRIIVEGMARGKFVIGADGGATRELICHGETGLLYKPMYPEDLADKILSYINETTDIPGIRQNAFDFVRAECHPDRYRKLIGQLVRDEIASHDHTKRSIGDKLDSNLFYRLYIEMLRNEQLSRELTSLKDEIVSAKEIIKELRLNFERKENEIYSLRNSMSWKLTTVMRYIHSRLMHLIKKPL